jgi:hypothetical protein
MPKFSGSGTKTRPPAGPTMTTGPAPTHEGGAGWEKDAKTALYTLGVTNMVSEPTFYESAEARDDRYRSLITQVTAEDPEWMQGFIPWLRGTANMRSAPLVAALEYAHAGGPGARSVIASTLHRADEPGEALGYWLSRYGRKIPMAVKRGIADGAKRLYNEYTALKYDGQSHGVRMGDVIELTHPKPESDTQGSLFKHLLDRRHGHFDSTVENRMLLDDLGLTKLAAAYRLDALPEDERRPRLREAGPAALADASYTWERLSGWLPGGMDAEAWEAIIPSMGYMALLRNLRNFEENKVDEAVLRQVADKLADPDEVAKSQQFPYRFFSAYVNSGTTYFAPALEKALDLSLQNVPIFTGRTLVLVDTSASMSAPVSARSEVAAHDIGALFGVAVAAHSKVDFVIYATDAAKVNQLPVSVLRGTELVRHKIGSVGHGTNTWPAVQEHYNGQDRIVVFTDAQDHPSRAYLTLPKVPIYVWDLGGYRRTNVNLDQPGRYCFGGFNDAAFRLIGLLEAGQDASWPWEA